MSEKSVTCSATIKGPRIPGTRSAVAWIKRCRNKTTHESGLCHWHRYTGGNNGPGART